MSALTHLGANATWRCGVQFSYQICDRLALWRIANAAYGILHYFIDSTNLLITFLFILDVSALSSCFFFWDLVRGLDFLASVFEGLPSLVPDLSCLDLLSFTTIVFKRTLFVLLPLSSLTLFKGLFFSSILVLCAGSLTAEAFRLLLTFRFFMGVFFSLTKDFSDFLGFKVVDLWTLLFTFSPLIFLTITLSEWVSFEYSINTDFLDLRLEDFLRWGFCAEVSNLSCLSKVLLAFSDSSSIFLSSESSMASLQTKEFWVLNISMSLLDLTIGGGGIVALTSLTSSSNKSGVMSLSDLGVR